MTSFPASHLRPSDPGSRFPEGQPGALLRVPVGDGWTERLPPAPAEVTVTVSLSSAAANAAHGEALRFLGYRVVDPSDVATGGVDVADFVVPARGAIDHPSWWEALVELADRAFPLAFGPVLAVLHQALRPHRAHWLPDRS